MSCTLAWPCKNGVIIWLSRREPIIPSHYSAKFDGDRHWEREDITFLICQVTSCDHVIIGHKTLCGKLLIPSHDYFKSDAYRSYASKDETFLFWHMASCKNMIKGTCDLVTERYSFTLSTHPTTFGVCKIKYLQYVTWPSNHVTLQVKTTPSKSPLCPAWCL